jgi:hypothetical protein
MDRRVDRQTEVEGIFILLPGWRRADRRQPMTAKRWRQWHTKESAASDFVNDKIELKHHGT